MIYMTTELDIGLLGTDSDINNGKMLHSVKLGLYSQDDRHTMLTLEIPCDDASQMSNTYRMIRDNNKNDKITVTFGFIPEHDTLKLVSSRVHVGLKLDAAPGSLIGCRTVGRKLVISNEGNATNENTASQRSPR